MVSVSLSFHFARARWKVDRVLANQSLFHDRGYTGHFQHSHCLVYKRIDHRQVYPSGCVCKDNGQMVASGLLVFWKKEMENQDERPLAMERFIVERSIFHQHYPRSYQEISSFTRNQILDEISEDRRKHAVIRPLSGTLLVPPVSSPLIWNQQWSSDGLIGDHFLANKMIKEKDLARKLRSPIKTLGFLVFKTKKSPGKSLETQACGSWKVDRVLANQSLFHDRGYTGHFQFCYFLRT